MKHLFTAIILAFISTNAMACTGSVNDQDPVDQDTVDPAPAEPDPEMDNGRG